jgi:hypothetical protein
VPQEAWEGSKGGGARKSHSHSTSPPSTQGNGSDDEGFPVGANDCEPEGDAHLAMRPLSPGSRMMCIVSRHSSTLKVGGVERGWGW